MKIRNITASELEYVLEFMRERGVTEMECSMDEWLDTGNWKIDLEDDGADRPNNESELKD